MNNNGPSIPYDGYVHAFYAHIIQADVEVRFQVWRQIDSTRNVTLIGQHSVVTTAQSLEGSFAMVCILLYASHELAGCEALFIKTFLSR